MIRDNLAGTFAVVAMLAVSACARPEPVVTASTVSEQQLTRLKLQSASQLQSFRRQRQQSTDRLNGLKSLYAEVFETVELGDIDMKDANQEANIAFIDRLRSDDDALRSQPFAPLTNRPMEPPYPPPSVDLSGLDKAVAGIERLQTGLSPTFGDLLSTAGAVDDELRRLTEERRNSDDASEAASP